MDENSSIGEYIKISRIQEGYKTQKQLSEVSGISQTTLSRIEAGAQRPQPDTLLQLSKYLHSATYGELMEKARYLDGFSGTDEEAFMSEFFDELISDENNEMIIKDLFFVEHARLDEHIEMTIKDLSKHDIFPIDVMKGLNSELKPLFDSKGIDMDECSTPRYLRELMRDIDFDTDFKRELYKVLLRVKNLLHMSQPVSEYYSKKSPSMELSEDEQYLVESYRKLSHDDQVRAIERIDTILELSAAKEEHEDKIKRMEK